MGSTSAPTMSSPLSGVSGNGVPLSTLTPARTWVFPSVTIAEPFAFSMTWVFISSFLISLRPRPSSRFPLESASTSWFLLIVSTTNDFCVILLRLLHQLCALRRRLRAAAAEVLLEKRLPLDLVHLEAAHLGELQRLLELVVREEPVHLQERSLVEFRHARVGHVARPLLVLRVVEVQDELALDLADRAPDYQVSHV